MKIYLDMDGVLTDFEKRYVEKFDMFPKDADKRRQHFWDNWKQFVDDGDFETLDKHEGCNALLDAMKFFEAQGIPIEILSSSGGGYSHDTVVEQKKKWLAKHNITYKPNIVPGGGHKARYAAPWNILVDDTEHVIERYKAAGGTAIHHKNARDTITQLHLLHLEWKDGA